MKIGIDGRFWNESGVGRYIRNLVRELQKIDKENEYVLFVSPKSDISDSFKKRNWKIVTTDIRWHTIAEQLQFPKLLNSYNLDLVHFPYFSVPIFVKIPFVVTIHDLILHHHSTGKATTLPKPMYYAKLEGYKFVMRQAARKAKKILAVSEATKKEIIDHLGVRKEKISVTYEGADENLKYVERKTDEKYFLYVGNAYPHKNLSFLIRTFSELPDTKVKLKIVGREDFFQKRSQKLAQSVYLNSNIEYLTDVDDTKLASLYSNALALVSPSLMEGFGLPLLEAMKLHCLVVASDIPSSHEICDDAAIYFNPNKRESLRAVLTEVIKGRVNKQTLISKGLQRSELFSWEKMAKETLHAYVTAL